MSDEPLIIKDALFKSAEFLARKGSESPRLDAEVLLGHVLDCSRLQLYLKFDRPLDEVEKEEFRELLKRRADHEPAAYITGRREFMSLSFIVTPDVLIPRPDTETLVEAGVKSIRDWMNEREGCRPKIFEVGIGSGAVSVSLLKALPSVRIAASDLSEKVLEVARKNAERHEVSERLELIRGDLFCDRPGPWDFIISNPPYLAEEQKSELAPEILEYEPYDALFSGKDGLDCVRRLIFGAGKFLSPGGVFLVEIGDGQRDKIKKIIEAADAFCEAIFVDDYAGRPRVLHARKR